jgi:2-polyprenyl-3-methyl-5-hydroxy-6-metoxy-1,4-benzoquinol methylase
VLIIPIFESFDMTNTSQNKNFSETDIFGQALSDYIQGKYREDIITYISLDEKDVLPLPYLFRGFGQMPVLEQEALRLCKGKILDVGCGAGSHSLYLQEEGFDVTGLDISPGAINTCRQRGLRKVVLGDILSYTGTKYDTILLLMHGIGMAETLERLDSFLLKLRTLLQPKGQILLDSTDIIYMFDKDDDGGYWVPGKVAYYGEVQFITEYRGVKSEPFPWLYLDERALAAAAERTKFNFELVRRGLHNDYLARLSIET